MHVEIEKFYLENGRTASKVVEVISARDEDDALGILRWIAGRKDLNSDNAAYVYDDGEPVYVLNIFQSANSPFNGSWSINRVGGERVEAYRVEPDEGE